jgi:hypothetical protein
VLRRSAHVTRSGQPRVVPSPGRRRELTRRSGSRTNRSWSRPLLRATSAATDQVALEARSLPQPEGSPRGSWLKRLQVGQPGSAVVQIGAARRRARSYSRGHTQTRRSVCVFDAPGGAPRRISPTATCLTPLPKRRMLISPLFPGRSLGSRSLERGRRPPERPGAALTAGAVSPP